MSRRYTHLFFDLDHTLWDYDENARETLNELLDRFDVVQEYALNASDFIDRYFQINRRIWEDSDLGLLGKDFIRRYRFPIVFDDFGIDFPFCNEIQAAFTLECPQKSTLFPNAKEVLSELAEQFEINLITNGFDEVQKIKVVSSGLDQFYDEMITSERAKSQKPDPGIFEYAMELTGASPETSIMIGDNLNTDILGAANAMLDQVYFNPNKLQIPNSATYEVHSLEELKKLLLPA